MALRRKLTSCMRGQGEKLGIGPNVKQVRLLKARSGPRDPRTPSDALVLLSFLILSK